MDAQAERVLLSLRKADPRLVLGAAEAQKLAPLAAEWLTRGVSSAGMVHALTAGLPRAVKCPAALLRFRLDSKMPPVPFTGAELVSCADCEKAFRPATGEDRCGSCRQESAAAEAANPARPGWRERFALPIPAGPTASG